MPNYKGVQENFKFLILEVIKQVEETQRVLENPDERKIDKILSRDDYIDNLKNIITNRTYRFLMDSSDIPQVRVDVIRAINVITSNLENIADFCSNIVNQLRFLDDRTFLDHFDYEIFFKEIIPALYQIENCLFEPNVDLALKICRTEFLLDYLYKKRFHVIMNRLKKGDEPYKLISTLFIFRYFERIGDCLLNIGEAAISAAVGEKLKIQQYRALEESFSMGKGGEGDEYDEDDPAKLFVFETVGETKSGCRIGRVKEKGGIDNAQWVIFKEGNESKLLKEKEGIDKWEEIHPGLPPKIVGMQKYDGNASLLLEFLEGTTFQKIVLNQDSKNISEALLETQKVLKTIWDKTRIDHPFQANFVEQVNSRINDVFKLHPNFDAPFHSIGSLRIPSFKDVLSQVYEIEKKLEIPFSVFIHGDFNTDNILYNVKTKQVNFIDLHRSCYMDYVQDISVFLISNFRIPAFEERIRERLNWVSMTFYRFAHDYATDNGDGTFNARLALGLIRSFITSTRFVLNDDFSKNMFHRAGYLMKRLVDHRGKGWDEFELPIDVLVY
jgi:phosphate uptake regulator